MKKEDQQFLKVADCYESPNNPRGKEWGGAGFEDLVKSVQSLGVLVPILVREKHVGSKKYEVIAGNRRLRAATKAKITEIPARIMELDDTQAREAAIVENLQREDVHPLEEGEAYRNLIENLKHSIADVAVKVGKTADYVKQRLFLTNLVTGAAKLYRENKLNGEAAVMIARLSEGNQEKVLANIKSRGEWARRPNEVKEFIKEHITGQLSYQPWLNDKDAAKAVGPCKTCPPTKGSLFGDVREGQCLDLGDWTRKMELYIAYRLEKDLELVKISKEYGSAKGSLLSHSKYTELGAKKTSHCAYAKQGIVARGEDLGTTLWICADMKCKKHHAGEQEYRQTPAELAKRKKEIARERAASDAKYKAHVAMIKSKAKWPVTETLLDRMVENALEPHGIGSMEEMARRLSLKLIREKGTSYSSGQNNYKISFREYYKKAPVAEKLQLYVELELSRSSNKKI